MITLNPIDGSDSDLTCSRLFAALRLSIGYGIKHHGIGLTQGKAFNRKFVTWAAEAFDWPGYTAAELFRYNKVLDEADVPPVAVVHDLMILMKLGRHLKGRFRISKSARALTDDPGALFGRLATTYLFDFDHARLARYGYPAPGNWKVMLDIINVEAERGLTEADLVRILYGVSERRDVFDRDYHLVTGALFTHVLRPLHWIGFLEETRTSPDLLAERIYTKTPLWRKALTLDTDPAAVRPVLH